MLATVFYAQPVGQLVACVVSIVVTALLRHHLLGDATPTHCVDECYRTIDVVWRWIVGFGTIPPIFAVILRFWIPESPRWLLEVKKNPMGIEAADYTRHRFFEDPFEDEEDLESDLEAGAAEDYAETTALQQIDIGSPAIPLDHQPISPDPKEQENLKLSEPMGGTSTQKIYLASPAFSKSTMVNQDTDEDAIRVVGGLTAFDSEKLYPSPFTKAQSLSTGSRSQDDAPSTPGRIQIQAAQNNQPSRPTADTWTDFWDGFRAYLFTDGSWTDLAGTSLTWFQLDFAFYMILVNSQDLISKIWATPEYTEIFDMLMQPSYRAIISTSAGALIGGALFIAMARYRWNLQFYGFLILAVLFVIVGACFIALLGGRYFAAVIVFYCLCNLFFDFGPNTSTYVVSE